MEPADLNSSDDARLETLLRKKATPLPDDGFSQSVLAVLPPARSARADPARQQWLVALAGAIVGTGFAIGGVLFRPALGADLTESLGSIARSFAVFADPLFVWAIVATAISLLYVFWPRPRLGR